MKVRFNNVWALLVEATDPEREWVAAYASCDAPETYNPRSVLTRLPGQDRYHMFDRTRNVLPAGFVPLLAAAALRDGVTLELEDVREAPCAPERDGALVAWLYPYQLQACVETIRRGGRGIIKAPPGAGKTEIFTGLTRLLPCEWLFVVHRTDIVGQTAKRFLARTGEVAGTFMKGRWERGTTNVTVASFQSIWAAIQQKRKGAKDLIESIQALAVDECHAQPADTFYQVSTAMKRAHYRVGFSATPFDRTEKDALRMVASLGPLLYEIPYQLLRSLGVLAQSRICMIEYRHDKAASDDATWSKTYRERITNNAKRNNLLADITVIATKPALVFVDGVKHGRTLQRLIRARGLKVDYALGKTSLAERGAKVRALEAGETEVLICTTIFQEGVDIPSLRAVIVAAAKSAAVAAVQRLGRGLRVDPGSDKDECELWDVLDRGQRWVTNHATARKLAYESGGHEVILRPASFLKGNETETA